MNNTPLNLIKALVIAVFPLLFLILFLIPVWGSRNSTESLNIASTESRSVSDSFAKIVAATANPYSNIASDPLIVQVGMFFIDIARLDLKECEFHADFYIWYKIPANRAGEWTPEFVEFTNGKVEFASPLASDTLENGMLYWSQRIKGVFREKFDLRFYPFDKQTLSVTIEDRENPAEKVLYVPDCKSKNELRQWLDPYLEIQDWEIVNTDIIADSHHYQTDFGLANGNIDSPQSYYSRLSFKINIKRLFIPHMVKFVIPLLIITGMAYLVFFINAKEFESQCAICVTSLLSAVALHNSLVGSLPSVGYLVVADKIFILFYIIIFVALVQTVIANNYAKTGNIEMAVKLDMIFQWLYPVALAVGGFVVWLTTFLG